VKLDSVEDDIFRLAVESSPAAMIVTSQDGAIQFANTETVRMFGYQTQELVGRRIDVLVPRQFRQSHVALRQGYFEVPSKRAMGIGRDLKAVRRDGSEFPVEIGLTPIKTAKGPLVLATVLDITARRDAELALAQRASELERANERLAQFAHIASHDLQEPLRKIAAFSDLLERAIEVSNPSDMSHANKVIRTSALRARSLVDDLLTYSRTINDTHQLEELDMRDEIDSALSDLSQFASESGAEIQIDVPHLRFTADRSQFARLISNIVSNAIKYRKPEQAAKVRIKSSSLNENAVLLEISDDGIGFDEKYALTIFEPFRRLHTQAQYPGTGIGLAICKSIADRHDWSLSVKSTPGKGTTFFVAIPSVFQIARGAAPLGAVTARMVTDDAGQPLHSIGVIRDIHDRKTAQTTLRTSEIHYRRLFEAAHDGVLLVDPDTRKIIDANPFMTKLLRYTRDQLIGKELYEIGLISDARASQDMFAELKRTQQIRYEDLPLESQGGQRREVEVVANLYDEDGQSVIQCNVRDITERKRAEEALARLAAIVESSEDAIVGKDLKGTITSWNSGAETMFGFSSEEIIGQSIMRIIPPEQQSEEDEILARIARGESIRHFETVRQRKDGSTIEISVAVSPIKDASGTIVGASKVARDITERKRAEIALRRSRDAYLTLIENNPFGVYLVDSEFRISKVSVGAQPVFANVKPLLGRDFEDVIRQLWQEPFASDVIARFRHTFETGEPYRTKDTTEPRGDIDAVESYDWRIERVILPTGGFGVVCYFYDMTDRKRYEEHISLLMHEVNHRAKNLLAVIQAVTQQTARSGDPATFEARLSDRIGGLTASHDLLVNNQWQGVEVSDLARGQLAHFNDARVLLDGPPVRLSAAAAQAIGMALHELATNAGKYGALGDNEGHVRISWKIAGAPKPTFTMQWLEENGPEVVPPSRSGFGQKVMVRMVEHAVDGTVNLAYKRTGLSWRLTAPLAGVQEASRDG
jgi:PAS domain S-box-containing protein